MCHELRVNWRQLKDKYRARIPEYYRTLRSDENTGTMGEERGWGAISFQDSVPVLLVSVCCGTGMNLGGVWASFEPMADFAFTLQNASKVKTCFKFTIEATKRIRFFRSEYNNEYELFNLAWCLYFRLSRHNNFVPMVTIVSCSTDHQQGDRALGTSISHSYCYVKVPNNCPRSSLCTIFL